MCCLLCLIHTLFHPIYDTILIYCAFCVPSKEKTISLVCVSRAHKYTEHSLKHVIHLPRIPLTAHSLYSSKRFLIFLCYARFCCVCTFFFLVYLLRFSSCLFFHFSFISCNRIKWRMISYFFDIQWQDSRIDLANVVERNQHRSKAIILKIIIIIEKNANGFMVNGMIRLKEFCDTISL